MTQEYIQGIDDTFDLLTACYSQKPWGTEKFKDWFKTRHMLLSALRYMRKTEREEYFYEWLYVAADALPEPEATNVFNAIIPELVLAGSESVISFIALQTKRKIKVDSAYILKIFMSPFAENSLEQIGKGSAPWKAANRNLKDIGVDFSVPYEDDTTVASFLASYELEDEDDEEEEALYRSLVESFGQCADLSPGLSVESANPIFVELVAG